tara:strand:- start:2656 stop:2862 length:207 start_codon:yes stop_codon:yes gene_type:complete
MSNNTHWLATEIRRIRLERGLSQITLANMANVESSALGSFELGRTQMQLAGIERVLDALDYEIDIHAK